MAQPRRSKRVDDNQGDIVKRLRAIKDVTVMLDVNDILVGYSGCNFLFEIKDPDKATKDGRLPLSQIKKTQIDLLRSWKGNYNIVYTFEEIIHIMGITL